MIVLQQVKVDIDYNEDSLKTFLVSKLNVSPEDIKELQIIKQSLDARKKPELFYVLSVVLSLNERLEQKIVKHSKGKITHYNEKKYIFPMHGNEKLNRSPVIIGSGPAGLFCAYFLAKEGYHPIVIERGECVEDRSKSVERFWTDGILNIESNVQFGEGGAGTFSDGKLNTMIKDKEGRIEECLRVFHEFGAPNRILYESKPHIGTDTLKNVVINLRKQIIRMGGCFYFNHKFVDTKFQDGSLQSIKILDLKNNTEEVLYTDVCILALGHSARDTVRMLYQKGINMEQKSFAVGMRVIHPQEVINSSQYGMDYKLRYKSLPAAPYKLTAQSSSNRGVYSFCMCPGGYVVNASSVKGLLAVNGMSYSKRDGVAANSAIVLTVGSNDFSDDSPLSGIAYQENLEKRAFELCNGAIPLQFYCDFKENTVSESELLQSPMISQSLKGKCDIGNLKSIFSKEFSESFEEGMQKFDRIIHGFASDHVILAGIESRTSSPVRIVRDDDYESNMKGLYPCGEGAGYAGGIVSAAVDGIKVAEKIAKRYMV